MTGDDLPATVWGPSDMSRGAADRRRLAASFDLMAAVLNGTTLPSLLKLVTERARSMAGVPLAFIALPAEEAHTLRVDVAVGVGSDRIRGLTVRRGRSMLGRAFTSRRALSARIVTDQTLSALPAGPILILPLDNGEATHGVLAVLGRPNAEPFSPSTARQLLLYADTAARLVQLSEDRRTTAPQDSACGRIIALRPPPTRI
ncbi:GAF domain-containing protein [Actinomadura madurae]|uniref:GAF domain-containing protein n=1 Tax=Actinomadura madurae TaxID=1993 RepID=UPI0020276321|nr:GAF domain-containing protein [Actinomadura madurae]MCP9951032.1 GAF domain-containing protein [Actinomadura madurae]MCQ0008214.1 GAF domain-containing protein [Actinomadura madurae]URM96578.1 GAF domain-containing protein [Actinomadura madurae]URN07259.1 GAF domain-containing protein [Actinomadura madurae]